MVNKDLNMAGENTFRILSIDYWNSGGGCMIGVAKVYFFQQNVVRWILTNEEYLTLSSVDTVFEYDELDFEHASIDLVEWPKDRPLIREEYGPLYKICVTRYACDEARMYGTHVEIPTRFYDPRVLEDLANVENPKGWFYTTQTCSSKVTIYYERLEEN